MYKPSPAVIARNEAIPAQDNQEPDICVDQNAADRSPQSFCSLICTRKDCFGPRNDDVGNV